MDHFTKYVAVYVPGDTVELEQISDSACRLFGGCTIIPSVGLWHDDDQLEREHVNIVKAYVANDQMMDGGTFGRHWAELLFSVGEQAVAIEDHTGLTIPYPGDQYAFKQ